MNISGKTKLLCDALCNRIITLILLFLMCVISMYVAVSGFSSYIYNNYWISKIEKTMNENPKNINYIDYQNYTEKDGKASRILCEYVSALDDIKYSGHFSSQITADGVNGIISDISLMDMCNLKLSENDKEKIIEYDGEYNQVFVGCNLKNQYKIGDVFSFYGDGKDDCIIVGFLDKGSAWLKKGKIQGASSMDSFNVDDSLVVLSKNYSYFDNSGGMPDILYFVCDYDKLFDIENQINKKSVEINIASYIHNEEDLLSKAKEENNPGNNIKLITSVFLFIIAIISVSAGSIMECLTNRKNYGIMNAFGVSYGDIAFIIASENIALTVIAGIITWTVKKIEIGSQYGKAITSPMMLAAQNFAYNICSPLILLMFAIVIIAFSITVPIIILKKDNAVEMIKDTK